MKKKNRTTTILLAIISCICFSLKANATVYEVSTAGDFISHWKNNDSIKITADIDLSSFTSDDIIENYTAELSGLRNDENYIYKGTETEEEIEQHRNVYIISNLNHMLAEKMTNAKIHDIMFDDCKPAWNSVITSTFSGTSLLTRYSTNCQFKNIVLYNITLQGQTVTGSSDAACLVCQDTGSNFTDIYAYACKAYCNYSYAGIIAAEATNSTFTYCVAGYGCAVYADGTVDNSYVGGIVGEATNVKFHGCKNQGYVASGKDCAGGISGKATNTEFKTCSNLGSVSNVKYSDFDTFSASSDAMYNAMSSTESTDELDKVYSKSENIKTATMAMQKGITSFAHGIATKAWVTQAVGQDKIAARISYWMAKEGYGLPTGEDGKFIIPTKDIYVTPESYVYLSVGIAAILTAYQIGQFWYQSEDDDNVGGIVGLMDGGSAKFCSNYGSVYTADAYAGGIVGQARNDSPVIENCQNGGIVKGYEQTGGIVGSIESGSVRCCLNTGNISNGNSDNDTFGKIYGEKSDGVTSKYNIFANNTSEAETKDCRGVTLKELASGEIAKYLNEKADTAVWMQTIGTDYYPTLNSTSDVVKADKIQTDIDPTVRTKNAATFLHALAAQYSDIVLTDDIDLSHTLFNLTSRYMPFCGTIDGQNHCLKNINYTIPYFEKATVFSNDNSTNNAGLMGWASHATFKNLELNNCKLDYCIGFGNYCGILVGHSDYCSYDNIKLTNGSGLVQSSDANGTLRHSGGLIGYSNHDTVANCSTDASCSFSGLATWDGEDTYIGGIIGDALGTEIIRCYNQAPVTVNEDYVGGIVSYLESGKIISCLNTGNVTGEEEVGGIAGKVLDSDVINCVNTGTIAGNASYFTDGEIGGVVGVYERSSSSSAKLNLCCNWGAVNNQCADFRDENGAIIGEFDGDDNVGNNYWSFTKDGERKSNGNSSESDVNSGSFTYSYNITYGRDYPLYQDIDLFTFGTNKPVPVSAAGTVYMNYLCDGTRTYSNKYKSSSSDHTADPDKFGLCSVCGAIKTAPTNIDIESAAELKQFALATNKGQDFTSSDIQLKTDCDMKDIVCVPIGTYAHPFAGTFTGNSHRIKNMTIDANSYAGLFGCVNHGTIKGVVMDSTCVIRSTSDGVAGIVGAAVSASGSDNDIIISECGNEATVIGGKNTAGILGGVYNNDNMYTQIQYCYNSGTIQGTSESAAIVGYGRKVLVVKNSYNTGTVTGYDANHYAVRYYYDDTKTIGVTDFYQLEGLPTDSKATTVTAAQCANGDLLYKIDDPSSHKWGQNLGTDATPIFPAGLYHKRKMTNTWGTVCLPYAISSDDDIQLYNVESCDANSENGKLILTPVDKVEANVPCFVKKLNADKDSICLSMGKETLTPYDGTDASAISVSTSAEGWDIVGTYNALSDFKDVYYMASNKIWYAEDPISIAPYRAYLTYDGNATAKSLDIFVDDDKELTQIGEIHADGNVIFYGDSIYNLAGQRVNKSTKGIIIKNGKKYINK